MKIKFYKPGSGKIILFLIMVIFFTKNCTKSGINLDTRDTIITDYETLDLPNDSLPHYLYQKKQDSIKKAKYDAEDHLQSGQSFLSVGISSFEIGEKETYYLSLEGFNLAEDVKVTSINGKTIIKYPVWDKEWMEKKTKYKTGYYTQKTSAVKFRQWNEEKTGTVYIPINNSYGRIIEKVLVVLTIILYFIVLFIIFYIPYRTLSMIAKGKAFTLESIRNLNGFGWYLIGLSLIPGFLKILFYLIYRSEIPVEFEFSFYDAILAYWEILIGGLVVLLFAKAFKQGYLLQNDQDLTV